MALAVNGAPDPGAQPDRLVVPAPAKLNAFLHVTGRRADGWHELETLYTLIDLADTLTLRVRDDGAIVRMNDVEGVPPQADLAIRAAERLKARTGTALGVEIRIDKTIPMGAGLGGGSSDAASVLLALNRLWRLGLSRGDLATIGVALGADVPFFVGGEAALARGLGERLTPVSLPVAWIVLVTPRAHVATASIFAAPELTRSTPSAKMEVFSEGYGRNDLAGVACARHPAVAEALEALLEVDPRARMTGSGACVFAAFASPAQAQAAAARLRPGIDATIARTLARHPLASFA